MWVACPPVERLITSCHPPRIHHEQLYKDCLRLVYHVAEDVSLPSPSPCELSACGGGVEAKRASQRHTPPCKFSARQKEYACACCWLHVSAMMFRLHLLTSPPRQHKNVNPNQVKAIVKQQFLMNAVVTDHKKLEDLKNAAMRALTNYVMHLSQKCVPPPTRMTRHTLSVQATPHISSLAFAFQEG